MRKYEIALLLDPTIEDTEVDDKFESVLEILKSQGAKIIEDQTLDWGKRKLAYPIKKKGNGIYRIYRFNAETRAITEIERRLRIDEQVLRSLIVLYDPETERIAAPAEVKK